MPLLMEFNEENPQVFGVWEADQSKLNEAQKVLLNLNRHRVVLNQMRIFAEAFTDLDEAVAATTSGFATILGSLEHLRVLLNRLVASLDKTTEGIIIREHVGTIKGNEAKLPLPPNRWPNTPAGSFFGFCGTSTPVHGLGAELPVGLQVMCPAWADAKALSIALAIEGIVGPPPLPDLTPFQ